MPLLGPMPYQNVASEASALWMSLNCQPNVGDAAQRSRWFRAIDTALSQATRPSGRIFGSLFGEDFNRHRAASKIGRVRDQTQYEGLVVGNERDFFLSEAARYEAGDRSSANAPVYVLSGGAVRREPAHKKSLRLVTFLFEGRSPAYDTLTSMLDRAFSAHIRKLDGLVAQLPDVVTSHDIPEDAVYPHYFEDAHPHLMEYLHRAFTVMNGGSDFSWEICRRETVEQLIETKIKREGVDGIHLDPERKARSSTLAGQIIEYGAFQLFCLMRQIEDGRPDPVLVRDLRRARNGRKVDQNDMICSGLSWRHLLEASRLIGNIDVIHANFETACDLAEYEQPRTNPEIVRLQVMSEVARLGKETGSSKPQYADAIERLRRLESDPKAGKVIGLPVPRRK